MQIVVYDPIIDRVKRENQPNSTTTQSSGAPASTPLTTATPSTTTVTTTQFIGGHGNHRFNITCKNIPTEGVNETVVHVFKGKYALYL